MRIADIPIPTIEAVLDALSRRDGIPWGDGFLDTRFDPPIELTAEDCLALWRTRDRLRLPEPARGIAHEYDPLDE